MQSKNQDDSVQLSSRYLQYCFAKQCVRGECPREILPVGKGDEGAVQNSSKNKGQKNIAWALRQRDYKDGTNFVKDDVKIRRLTPTECERLQGFPDGWTTKGNYDGEVKDMSDTQRYKCCGNAVTVKVVEEVLKDLLFKPDLLN